MQIKYNANEPATILKHFRNISELFPLFCFSFILRTRLK